MLSVICYSFIQMFDLYDLLVLPNVRSFMAFLSCKTRIMFLFDYFVLHAFLKEWIKDCPIERICLREVNPHSMRPTVLYSWIYISAGFYLLESNSYRIMTCRTTAR